MKIRVNHHRSERSELAFTLIEVLLAFFILAGIMTAIFASWTAILRGSKVGLDAAAEAQRQRITQDCINTTLSSAVLFQQNLQYYAFVTDTSNDRFAFLSLVAHLPDSFPGAGLFGEHSLRRVTFSVEATNGASALVMQQNALLVPTNADEAGYRLVLADDITKFLVEFWDTNLNDWNSDWVLSNQLPQMVKVTLGFGKSKRSGSVAAENDLYSVVSIAGTTITPDIQIGTGVLGGAGGGRVIRPPVAPPPPNNVPPVNLGAQNTRPGNPFVSTPNPFVPNIPGRTRSTSVTPVFVPGKGYVDPNTGQPVQTPYNSPYLGNAGRLPRHTNSSGQVYVLITNINTGVVTQRIVSN